MAITPQAGILGLETGAVLSTTIVPYPGSLTFLFVNPNPVIAPGSGGVGLVGQQPAEGFGHYALAITPPAGGLGVVGAQPLQAYTLGSPPCAQLAVSGQSPRMAQGALIRPRVSSANPALLFITLDSGVVNFDDGGETF